MLWGYYNDKDGRRTTVERDEICVNGETTSRMAFVMDASVKILAAMIGAEDPLKGVLAISPKVRTSVDSASALWDALCTRFVDDSDDEVEQPNENGDVIDYITEHTAPCSEIAKSFGSITASAVAATAKRLDLKPFGIVVWKMTDGTKKEAKSYDLAAWKAIKNDLLRRGKLYRTDCVPPDRIYPDGDE
jgi:hypothetical protein